MSANPLPPLPPFSGADNQPAGSGACPVERRKRTRTRVHWRVLLFRTQGAEAVASITQDLSSSGFYCFTAAAFAPGEVLTCALKIPSHDPSGKHLERNLECKIRVVRVQPQMADGGFGVACHIEDYRFVDLVQQTATCP